MQDEDLIDGVLTFEETTDGIRVAVQSYYLPDQSEPEDRHFVWAYRIRVTNEGGEIVQLLRRHWIITDARGGQKEVKGEGVIGEQPFIAPGDSYTYTSGTPLATPTGFMRGSYEMSTLNGKSLTIAIPAFSLDSPHMALNIN